MPKDSEEGQTEKQDTAKRLSLKKEPITPDEESVGRKFGPNVSRRRPKPRQRPRRRPKKQKD